MAKRQPPAARRKRPKPSPAVLTRSVAARKKSRPRGLRSSGRVLKAGSLTVTELEEVNQLRAELERAAAGANAPLRWNADPDDVQRSVAQLVLTLVEFIRRLLERQAIRRMDAGTLTPEQIEAVGQALMKLEETVRDIAARFGIPPDDLNLDLGPVGKLM